MSNIVENNIILDLNRSAIQTIYAKQYDNNTREIKIEVVNQGKHINIKSLGYAVFFKGITSTGKQLLNRCEVDNDDIIHLELTSTILHDNGHLNGEIILLDSNSGNIDPETLIITGADVISTMPFILHVKSSTFEDGDISEEEYSALNDLIATVVHLEDEVEDNEEERQSNEQERISNEINRNNDENVRKSNENTRITNENTRISNENTRQSNEGTRQSNEQIRQTNENIRQTNETSRIGTMEQIETDLQTLENELDTVVLKRQLGVPSTSTETGVATLDTNGQVPESQLPSYVDDVLEGRAQNVTQSTSGAYSATAFILKGESTACIPEEDKIYIDTTDLIQYRWSGSIFVSVGSHLALGETSSTAFPGNRGKIIEDDYLSKTGDIKDNTVTFTQASTRVNINSGEAISTIMGKIKKFFADLKTVAFTGNASDVSFNNTGTTSSATTVQAGLKEALTNSAPTASSVPYTNTTSGLSATNVQGAIDEVDGKIDTTKQIANGIIASWSSAQSLSTGYVRYNYGQTTNYNGGVAISSLHKGILYKVTVTGICSNVVNDIEMALVLKTANTLDVDTDSVAWAFGKTQISGTSFAIETYISIPKNVSPTYCQYWFRKSSSSTSPTVNSINAKWEEICVNEAIDIGDYDIQSRISTIEPKSTSSQAYSTGQYFTHGDKLKRVTSAIASGDTISSSNTEDTTIGAELNSRAFMNKSVSANEPADMNDIVQIGAHSINPEVTTLNTPNSKWGYVEVFYHGTGGIVQLWTDTDNESMYIRTKSGSPLVWSDWKVYAQKGYNIQLTSANLDDVVAPGKYYQGSSSNCTVARNYPTPTSGYLEVEVMGSNVVIQTYHPSSSNHYQVSFQRRQYNGTWEAWGSDDWISLLQVPGQITIPTTGYSITLNHSVFNRCRQKRIITFGVNELPQNGFSSNGTYAAYNFMVNSNSYYVLRWENFGTSPNACKLYYYVNGTATQITTGNATPLIQGILGNRGTYVTYQLSK